MGAIETTTVMEDMPKDPFMLLSWVNMKLRDRYENLDSLCDDLSLNREELENKGGWWEKSGISAIRYAFTTESREETADVLAGRMQGKTQTGHFRRGIE